MKCQCNLVDGIFVSVMADLAKQLGQPVPLNLQVTEEYVLSSCSILAVVGLICVLGIFVPIFSIIQDKKDMKLQTILIQGERTKMIIDQISKTNHESAAELSLKCDDINSYAN